MIAGNNEEPNLGTTEWFAEGAIEYVANGTLLHAGIIDAPALTVETKLRRSGALAAVLAASLAAGLVAAGAAKADDATPTPGQAWRTLTRIDVEAGYQLLKDNHPGAAPEAQDPAFVSALEAGHKRALERADMVTSYEGYVATLGEFARSVGDGHVWSNARFLPRTVRWAGIVATKRGPDWVVASDDAKVAGADLLGAKIVSCDGEPTDALARDVLHYRTVVSVDAMQVVYGGWLLIDEGNPFLQQPKACDFDRSGKRATLTLNWNSIGRSDLIEHHWYQPLGHAGFDLRQSGQGYWIAMQELWADAQKVIDQANAKATEIRAAPYVVVDVRGNGGGRDRYARDLAEAVYGAPYVEAKLGPKDAAGGGCEQVYRATAGNIRSISAAADHFGKEGDATAAAEYTRAVTAMKAAQAAGHALTGPAVCKHKAQSGSHGGASLMQGKVYLLTDAGCFSSCIQAAQFFTKLGATQIGQTTGADTHYSQVFEITLPSGMATFSTLRSIMTDAPKAIGPYVPKIAYEGDIADTASLEKWVGEIARR